MGYKYHSKDTMEGEWRLEVFGTLRIMGETLNPICAKQRRRAGAVINIRVFLRR